MKHHYRLGGATVLLALLAGAAFAAEPPTSGPPKDGEPGWRLTQGFPDPGGRMEVDALGQVTVQPRTPGAARTVSQGNLPSCAHSTVCTRKGGPSRQSTDRVVWDQTPGFTFAYPYHQSPGPGGDPGVAVDSKGFVWIMQRKPKGMPQIFKYSNDGKLILTIGNDELGYLEKAHGMAIDPHDNVWFTDANGATVQELDPDGTLIRTIGIKDTRGDWDETKNQHLLWQPTAIAFAPSGDMYIGEGHANESPNDVDSPDPADQIGASRVLHFDKDGKFVGQWFGDDPGPGKFDQVHGMAVDPITGNVWLADREEYRIVIYSSTGKFVRTLQTRNLICAIGFDAKGQPWVATGQDGQLLRLDHNGKVVVAVGGGMGIALGKFIEAAGIAFDKAGNIYVGDTSLARIAKIALPKSRMARSGEHPAPARRS